MGKPGLTLALALAWLAARPLAGPCAEPGDPILLGSRLEPFVDRYLIDSMQGVALELHPPRPAGAALRFDRPWEGRFSGYVTVLRDGDLYRMYYRGLPIAGRDGSEAEVTCYAESRDGIEWTKPDLGLFEVGGTRENNVVLAASAPASHNFAPFLDKRPGVDPAERYKALGGVSSSGLWAFASPDGVRWRKMREQPVLTSGAFDSQNVSFWSEAEGRYLCYYRTWSRGDFAGFRSVSRATSPDFLRWSEGGEMSFGATPREHIYTNQTEPYFRAPHLYIATAARFMPGRRVVNEAEAERLGVEAGYSGDCSDTVLLTSRGGLAYDRTFMEALVRPGLGLENWTSRTNYPARGLVPTGEKEMSIYIQKGYGQPGHRLERYVFRIDGLASIRAPYQGGEMVTRPLVFEGSELYLNFATSAAGSIVVAVEETSGEPGGDRVLARSRELIGDWIERRVEWESEWGLEAAAGRPVRLRIALKDADLYSIRFR